MTFFLKIENTLGDELSNIKLLYEALAGLEQINTEQRQFSDVRRQDFYFCIKHIFFLFIHRLTQYNQSYLQDEAGYANLYIVWIAILEIIDSSSPKRSLQKLIIIKINLGVTSTLSEAFINSNFISG
ncbi:hypothetical protein ACJX0J_039588 [Zea mays]